MHEHLRTSLHRDLIYDVGMHKGEDTLFYLHKGFRVIAFEANPILVSLNIHRFSAQIKDGQLTIVDGAIAGENAPDTVTFFSNDLKTEWGTIYHNWAMRNEDTGASSTPITVRTIDFSDCIRRYGMPYYMKIDIEGADVLCLRELLKFDVQPSYISIESDKACYDNIVNEFTLLSELGYERYMAVQQADICRRRPPMPATEGRFVNYTFTRGSSGCFGRELGDDWKSLGAILKEYKSIFLMYRRFGDGSLWHRNVILRRILYAVSIVTRNPIPGWYDTHAMHRSESAHLVK